MNNNNNGSNSHAGVRRSRDTDVTTSSSSKRQKLDHENLIELEIQSPKDVHVNSSPELSTSAVNDDLCLDPKVEDETSISSSDGFSREITSASSEICLDSDEMESSSALKNKKIVAPRTPTRKVTVTKNPTAAEIDEFFAAAEKKEQKRFTEKYNFDFANDVPMEGRYQWIRLKP